MSPARRRTAFGVGLFAAVSLLVSQGQFTSAAADSRPGIVVENGVTQPVFGYADAIREHAWVDAPFDSDHDGVNDQISVDIMRPRATEQGLKVPVVMDASPYYSTLGRGNESELKQDTDGDGLLDKWPLFYDNYFVPRGYAVVLLDMVGTNNSTGCPTTNGTPDNLSAKVAIDWLNGRGTARDADGDVVASPDWHNGKTGMIGKSYDGNLAMATAVTGVEGLSTIVPIGGPSNYYDYTRKNGVVTRGNNYVASLANTVTDPDRRAHCAPVREELGAADGDDTGDYSDFWAERNYVKDVANVRASVLMVHGLHDDNVRPDHFSQFWAELAKHDVPRKLLLGQEGHVDPFDFRRTEWVDTLHRWFDHWLQDVPNDIMKEPRVDIERAPDVFESYRDWPVPGAKPTKLWFQPAEVAGGPTGLSVKPAKGRPADLTFHDNPSQTETQMVSDTSNVGPNRLVFLSEPLTAPLHVSGTPVVRLNASADQTDTNLGAVLVDYGPQTRLSWETSGEGIRTLTTEDCWGESSPRDDACYKQTAKNIVTSDRERVSKGIMDALNRNSLTTPEPLVPGEKYDFDLPLLPVDHVFQPGHRIGLIVVGSYRSYSSVPDQTRANISVTTKISNFRLPLVGGRQAASRAGL
ncbi:Xaa-Pro dipeptidyl-peptidase [Nonomuraea aridisoli]|uniref:Xaa-Pro dipeptidyl-peptidase n=1 Tax=Nonomuraea aridisoli TaxID=2070368 RepID=A0A2W2F5R6_9ACTN|nr:Xaa-Pro dipeptidyl-peptidase [Nonomuraea aridisoli]PZG21000.1 X-prolyl-dipeptidyl aminopeptidase [Nonomuraea aridisoli]